MTRDIHEERIGRLQKLLEKAGDGGLFLTASKNLYYFTGFYEEQDPRFLSLFIPVRGKPVFLVPELYGGQVAEVSYVKDIVTWKDGEDPYAVMAGIVRDSGVAASRLAVDDSMWSVFLLSLQQKLPEATFTPARPYMTSLRQIKSQDEKELMMHIGSVTDEVMEKVTGSIAPGMTELQVADMIERGFREAGAEPSGRTAVVGSGVFSAEPHYRATSKRIERGDAVVLDFGGFWRHYRSDMTRTVFVGEPDREFLRIYDIVRKAHDAAIEFVRPGVTAQDVDRTARKIISDAGYAQYFTHRTGHGIGLEVHEEPNMVEGNTLVLEHGMSFSIEPGIYLPGRYGVRVEDCVIVTKDGCETFTHFSRDLIIIR